ncbi:hypothetical protein [uncultured Aquimarina sp.]|uniref:hypothetical protein n=1 Tax=uncultured Aquimarina sp. TaxID=575652 RepID=UPI00262EBF10|nr:hypothetical protein [uncultured Aquimarina sp.]
MTKNKFIAVVQQYIEKGNCYIHKDREILLDFKKSGGTKEVAKKLLEELASELSDNETLQDRVYDILDIVTGWCSAEVRVWK